ncbi:MAG: 4-(cytidine 5'-diphospho)-2-C-methyl-D-erythritol kinase [Halanaerobiales bacterium]|nr:4-(cytidine 5'-diphospho)-2-C-methyl-D-erythritol kinase [Halanaerobiales bacterium]
MQQLKLFAYAKINLFLDVKNLRDDNYHNLNMLMQSIKLHDEMIIKKSESGIKIKTNNKKVPVNNSNLAYQAAEKIFKKAGYKGGINIYIDKKIPVAAGLAGGSTDAAAILNGLNTLCNFNLDKKVLFKIATQIGCDVPFCLKGGTAYATGRGNKLKFLKPLKKYIVILVKPPQMVSTARIYQLYDKIDYQNNLPVKRLVNIIKNQAEMNINDGWANNLEPITKEIVADIKEIKQILKNYGFGFTMMTGSGPTVFSLINKEKEELAKEVVRNWEREQDFITLTETKNSI